MKLKVNGRAHTVEAPSDTPLLWVLRETLGLTGAKYGCGLAQCGACTVHIDGAPTRSCRLPLAAIGDAEITTIEGVSGPAAQALQSAWTELDVPQCGYCQSGQIMSASALLGANPAPTDAEIDTAMSGNLCRCATYHRIRAGIHLAASRLK